MTAPTATDMAVEARKRWELENNVQVVDMDQIFQYDEKAINAQQQARPWSKDPHFFQKVKISAIALLKMVMHARSGGNIEIMGLLVGKVAGDTMVVVDCFPLPVQGTETRVNAGCEANEFMVQYLDMLQKSGRKEAACGWYHSHPGYGCWLSGIDVSTQLLYQSYQDPFIAIVVDPTRTVSAGKVEIGAFRTFPQNYKPPEDGSGEKYQAVPLHKIEDFGVHCKSYYPLEVSYFRSSLDSHLLDQLWNKYWVSTLSSSALVANRSYCASQVSDWALKLEQAQRQSPAGSRGGKGGAASSSASSLGKETPMSRLAKDTCKGAGEQLNGLMSLVMKDVLFNLTPSR